VSAQSALSEEILAGLATIPETLRDCAGLARPVLGSLHAEKLALNHLHFGDKAVDPLGAERDFKKRHAIIRRLIAELTADNSG